MVQKMEINESFYHEVLDDVSDGVYFVDTARKIIYWNRGAERITGYTASEVLGFSCYENILVHVDDEGRNLCVEGCPLFDTIRDGRKRTIQAYLHHKDGHRVPVSVTAYQVKSPEGKIIGAKEIFHIFSTDSMAREKIEHSGKEALLDPLTGLTNRRGIENKLRASLEEQAGHDIPFGIIIVYIEDFKSINNTYGNDTGDDVLRMVAKTLGGNIYSGDLFGRWSDDEFICIITEMNERLLNKIAKKLHMLVEKSFIKKSDVAIKVTVSIGAALARENDTVVSILERAADELKHAGNGDNATDRVEKKHHNKGRRHHFIPLSERISSRIGFFIKNCKVLHLSFELVLFIFLMILGLLLFLSFNHLINY